MWGALQTFVLSMVWFYTLCYGRRKRDVLTNIGIVFFQTWFPWQIYGAVGFLGIYAGCNTAYEGFDPSTSLLMMCLLGTIIPPTVLFTAGFALAPIVFYAAHPGVTLFCTCDD